MPQWLKGNMLKHLQVNCSLRGLGLLETSVLWHVTLFIYDMHISGQIYQPVTSTPSLPSMPIRWDYVVDILGEAP